MVKYYYIDLWVYWDHQSVDDEGMLFLVGLIMYENWDWQVVEILLSKDIICMFYY